MEKRTTEYKTNVTEEDVLLKLKTLSSMLQQEYLENLLERLNLEPRVRILSARRLADLYARRGMYASGARIVKNVAMMAPTFVQKKELSMEAGMLSLKAGDYLLADDCFRHAGEEAPAHEKDKIIQEASDLFLFEAEQLEKRGRMARAVQLYEKILHRDKDQVQERKIKERLVILYEKLGRIQDHLNLRNSLK